MIRILVPTDFSPTAEKAFRYALDIASRANGTVTLYHSETAAGDFAKDGVIVKGTRPEIKTEILKKLDRHKKKVTNNSVVPEVFTVAGSGPLLPEIFKSIEGNQFDLICMGTRGNGNLKNITIGSIATKVITRSRIPVLLVPAGYELNEPAHFIYASNYHSADSQALHLVERLARIYKADIRFVHLSAESKTKREHEQAKNEFENFTAAIKPLFTRSKMSFDLIESAAFVETMLNLDKRYQNDLMIMVRRDKSFFQKLLGTSFTEEMAYLTKKPLLVLPEPSNEKPFLKILNEISMSPFIIPFNKINLAHLPEVGGKNASLGEMVNKLHPMGIEVPDGFAVTVESYNQFLMHNKIRETLHQLLNLIDTQSLSNLPTIALQCRTLVAKADLPDEVKNEIRTAYRQLSGYETNLSVAVRSSATAEDLPTASFAGQHDSFLNICGEDHLLQAVHDCYVSLFNDRAIKYRIDNGFEHMKVGLSVGVQNMIRSDEGCAGVIFTIDPESGFKNVIYITGAWGLGENVVQGAVNPDEFWIFKPTLEQGKDAIIRSRKGEKEHTMVYDNTGGLNKPVRNIETPMHKRNAWILSEEEVSRLARWSFDIEKHYGMAMDIEWGKDGLTHKIYILQARPETVHSQKEHGKAFTYTLKEKGKVLCKGKAVGKKIISGPACIIHSLSEAKKLRQGDILVADITNPDWNSLLRKAVSIVTNKGGRTSHSAIVARELGIAAIVGTGNATQTIKDGQMITVANMEGDEGMVLEGAVPFEVVSTDLTKIPTVETRPLFILADPARAFELSHYPAKGVGLLRMEFIINNSILIHPMALVQFDELPDSPVKNTIDQMTKGYKSKTEYFVHQLSEAIATVAAAFYPKEVILRMSDFKSNEYASLIGGQFYEPTEENPMIGFRGASRYYDPRYSPGFKLECDAVLRVRNKMGLSNVKVMIPFCRTIKEAQQVLETMKSFGLARGENGLEVYVMIEIPSNVILADKFAQLFDGFSIGSNDLTQLTLGLDRDSEIVSHLFDENNEAVKTMIAQAITAAKNAGIKIGLCGQAPSDFPAFSQFLVEQGIDSISFTPDALIKGIENISKAEKRSLVKV